ncbi:MAG TPA: pilus assembly protein PilM, partial [Spirochaetota bacterium]
MFESIAAIDIGNSSVKVVLAKRGLRDFHISDLIEEPVELSEDGREEAQKRAIERLLGKQSLKGAQPLVNLPMEKAIIRHFEFPFTDRARIAEVVPFEAQENIPFQISDLDMDFQFMGDEHTATGRVLVAATHSDTITDLSAFWESAGLCPVHVGLESNALFECYSYFSYTGDENVLILDIGYSKTIINIVRDNVLLYTRCFGSGVGSIISEIAESQKISEDDARSLFQGLRLDLTDFDATITRGGYKNFGITKPKLRAIHSFAKDFANEITEQINLTIKSFTREFGTIEFTRILFSGGGSHLSGIGSILAKKTGLHAERAEFPIATGMALSYFTHRNERINFLKGDFRPTYLPSVKGQYRLAIAFGIGGVALIIINLLVSFLFQAIDAKRYHAAL